MIIDCKSYRGINNGASLIYKNNNYVIMISLQLKLTAELILEGIKKHHLNAGFHFADKIGQFVYKIRLLAVFFSNFDF